MLQEIPVDISVGGEKEQEVVYYDYSFGPQLLEWQKIEREDQKWIDRYERVVHDPYIQLGEGISGHRVPFNHMLCGLDEFYAKLLKPPKLPRDVMMPLLRHQMLFLTWASEQELSVAAGGILGDDMEMGKNIQAIAHVYASREVDRERYKEAVGCTLVVTLSVGQWVDDIARCTIPGSNKVLEYHGQQMNRNEIRKNDFVLTTYSTVEAEYRSEISHGLHSIKWNRIILDEANKISNRSYNVAKACFALEAKYRWCFSSDPYKNDFRDLDSMVLFLKTPPYSYYFCTYCNCKTLDPVSVRSCCSCGHDAKVHFRWWRKYVIKPRARYANKEKGERATLLLKYKYLRYILLRRKYTHDSW